MKSYSDYKWAASKLYLGQKNTGVGIVNVAAKSGMYRVVYEIGDYSENMYNKTRAKDNAIKYEMSKENKSG